MRMTRLAGMLCSICLGALTVTAQTESGFRFFRVVGPTTTVITALSPDGDLSWSNALPGVTCRVQIASSLTQASNWQDYVTVAVTSTLARAQLFSTSTPTGMAYIPAGSFQMGNSMSAAEGYSDEVPVHTVYVSAFYMDRTEVTGEKWREVYNWAVQNGYNFSNTGSVKGVSHPVQTVNWYDAARWANARSQMEGLTPCYTTNGSIYKQGENTNVACNWTANGYRLPTEAEWEKAARGGLSGQRFPWGNTITHSQANYYSSSSYSSDTSPTRNYHPTYATGNMPYTSPVGSFAPNAYGLYDMAGNLWEWNWDWYGNGYYSSSPGTDPRGPASGSDRMGRGGSWTNGAKYVPCRISGRQLLGHGNDAVGFRLARTAVP